MSRPVIVTGGSRGIGAATARLLAQRGHDVAISYAGNEKAARSVVSEIEAAGRRAVAIQGDVAVEADVVRLFAEAEKALGAPYGLVNNAGMLHNQSRLDAMSEERLTRSFAVNVVGSFLCAREAVKRMSTRFGGKGGSIVNVSSVASRLGGPNEYIDYAATKGAIDSMTIGLAKEVGAEGVRVNAVRPGLIITEIHASGGEPGRVDRLKSMVPMGRGGTAEEVAAAIVWLISDEASYITGALLDISAGR
ncbi:MAG: SDR family oxidoreductase [Parvibaculaceae bacterium]